MGESSDGGCDVFLGRGSVDVERDWTELPPGGASATHLALGADPVLVGRGAGPPRASGAGRRGRRGQGQERRPHTDAVGMEPPVTGVAHDGLPQLLLAPTGRAGRRRVAPTRLPRVRRRRLQRHRRQPEAREQPSGDAPYGPKRSIPQLERAVEPEHHLERLLLKPQLLGGRHQRQQRRGRELRRRRWGRGSGIGRRSSELPRRRRRGGPRREERGRARGLERRRGRRLVEVDVEMRRAIHGRNGGRSGSRSRSG